MQPDLLEQLLCFVTGIHFLGEEMLTAFDKELLNIIQRDLPIAGRPYAIIAERLGTDEDRVISRLKELAAAGYVRRIGPFFDSSRLGYVSTLVALKVEAEALPAVAAAVNAYDGVTHNYEREGIYNLWFALISPDLAEQGRILEEVGRLSGVKQMLNLPAERKYKVNVQFTLE